MRKSILVALISVIQGEPTFSLVRKAQMVAPTAADDDQSISDISDQDYYEEYLQPSEFNAEKALTRQNLVSEELPNKLSYEIDVEDMSALAREIALATPINLMDVQIPSSEELLLKTPLRPGDESQSSLDNKLEIFTSSKDHEKYERVTAKTSDENDNGMTASGVYLHFEDTSENSDNSEDSEISQKSAPLDKITGVAKWALERLKYLIGWRTSSVSESSSKFMESLIFPEEYNVNYSHKNGFYDVGFAYAPKIRSLDSPAKFSPSGQDSFFISGVFGAGSMALGITEGIDERFADNMDSSGFSRELCHAMKNVFSNDKIRPEMDPVSLQKEAFEVLKDNANSEKGSATVLVAVFTPRNTVQISSLGVSQAILVRNGKVKYTSTITLNNCGGPCRLTKASSLRSGSGLLSADSPEDGNSVEWELQKEDYLVFTSDGITRNLEMEQIEGLINIGITRQSHASAISSTIFSRALFRSMQAPVDSRGEWTKYGGFPDDMTIILVKVKN